VRLRPVAPRFPQIALRPGESKTLGRSLQADIVVDDPSLSRLHARMHVDGAGVLHVEDLDSTNGILINGTRASRSAVSAGDRLHLGVVEYVAGDAADEPQQAGHGASPATLVDVATRADRQTLEALLATSHELMAFGDLPALLERVLDRLQGILKPDRAAILLVDAGGALTPRAVRPHGAYTSVSQFASSTVVREALGAQRALLVEDALEQPRLQLAASLADADVRSVVCVPLLGRTGAIGALYADRVGFGARFSADATDVAMAFAAHVAAALETARLYEDRERHFRDTLEAFARAIDARDSYTAGHSERVTRYTLALARRHGMPDDQLETLRRAGMLHDIGKVGVRDAVLLKSGPLDAEERAAMEAHVTLGCRMLEGLSFLAEALPAIRGHHERWDGRGYPDRLAGNAIHLHARLMAVADAYDAMTSARPYRRALGHAEAARRIRAEPGRQFDPAVVETFVAIEAELRGLQEGQTRAV
jgi:putative nucleotidyltransferase with HDIG domain